MGYYSMGNNTNTQIGGFIWTDTKGAKIAVVQIV